MGVDRRHDCRSGDNDLVALASYGAAGVCASSGPVHFLPWNMVDRPYCDDMTAKGFQTKVERFIDAGGGWRLFRGYTRIEAMPRSTGLCAQEVP